MSALTDSVRFYPWLLYSTGEFLVLYWPVTLGMLGLIAVALTARSPLRNLYFREGLGQLAAVYLVPLIVLLIGTVFRYELHGPPHPNWREPSRWYGYVLYAVLVLHAIVLVGLLVSRKGSRVRSTAILLPSFWLSICAFLPAGFAIAGVGP
jgi:hypothetical protein